MGKAQPNGEGSYTATRITPRIPLLDADDLPGDDDWTLITALRGADDIDLERHADPCGSLRLATSALE